MRMLAVVAATLVLGACGGSIPGLAERAPEGAPYIQGTVTSHSPVVVISEDCIDGSTLPPDGVISNEDPPICTDPDSPVLGSVLVEAEGEVEGEDKASVTITRDTTILREDGQGFAAATFDDLPEGQTVQVWITGAVAESYPVQVTATAIVLLGD